MKCYLNPHHHIAIGGRLEFLRSTLTLTKIISSVGSDEIMNIFPGYPNGNISSGGSDEILNVLRVCYENLT